MRRKKLKPTVVSNFVLEVAYIDPIQNILTKLEQGIYRDCDVSVLDTKLHNFMGAAANMMGAGCPTPDTEKMPSIMNEYAKDYYKTYFKGLLNFFKSKREN